MELREVDPEEIKKNKKKPEINGGTQSANRYDYTEKVQGRSETKKSGKGSGKGLFVAGTVLFLLSLTVLAVSFLYVRNERLAEQAAKEAEAEIITYTQEQVDSMVAAAVENAETETEERVTEDYLTTLHNATSVESGTWNLLREYFPDEVVFTDGTKFTYIGVNKDLKPNILDTNNFVRDPATGYVSYTDDGGTVTSYVGIDVSTFQKDIDWEKVAASGVDFAIIRCGFRGYGTGRIVEDSCFTSHIEGALAAGLQVGVYFFTQAITEDEAREEADFVLEKIAPYNITGPVIIDVEPVSDAARTDDLTGTELTDCVVAFCERVKEAGKTPMIYSGVKYFVRIMETERLEPYAKWYAYYNDPLYFPYEISMWQYSMNGTVDGINGEVDLDVLFEKWW